MSGFDKAAKGEADRAIGFVWPTCEECKFFESEGHPCNVCPGPISYFTSAGNAEAPYEDPMGYAGDPDAPYDPGMDDR